MKCPFIDKWDCPLLDPEGEGNCPLIREGYCLLIDDAIRESIHTHELSSAEKIYLHNVTRDVVSKVFVTLMQAKGGENGRRDR